MSSNKEELTKKISQVVEAVSKIDGVYPHDIRNFIDGNISISKNGRLRLTVSLDADELLESRDAREVLNGNWKMVPLIVFVEK